ncbi:MAG: hypothetical protein Kow0098_16320 [Ignavibacteriaceae bacterium]
MNFRNTFIAGSISVLTNIILLALSSFTFAQNSLVLENGVRFSSPYRSSGSFLENHTSFPFYKAARSFPVFILNPGDNWSASRVNYFVGEQKAALLPFGFQSPDLLPVVLLNTEKVIIKPTPSISLNGNSAGGEVIFVEEEIQDSLTVKFRSYIGGETGDPLIHRFTKPELNLPNKNKIAPSGELSVSNSSASYSYRINAGYAGFFSTGSGNDGQISEINNYHFQKQDKQILLKGKLIHNIDPGLFTIKGSFHSHYGWAVTPFISTFAHVESYIYNISANAQNLFDFIDIYSDFNSTDAELNEAEYFEPAKFSLAEYNIHTPLKFILSDKFKLKVSPGITVFSVSNSSTGLDNGFQKIFSRDLTKNVYNLSVKGFAHFGQTSFNPSLSFTKYFSEPPVVSGTFDFAYQINQKITAELSVGSVVKFPDLFQLYGNFNSYDDKGFSYNISGNDNLSYQRNNFGGIFLQMMLPDLPANGSAGIIYYNIEDPVKQLSADSYINEAGVHLREAVYTNLNDQNILNTRIELSFAVARIFNVKLNHSYYFVKDRTELPAQILYIDVDALISGGLRAAVTFSFRGQSVWDIYAINDKITSEGKNLNSLPSFDNTNFLIQQYINQFLFFNKLTVTLLIENLTDSRIRYLPSGNIISRAVTFLIQAEL